MPPPHLFEMMVNVDLELRESISIYLLLFKKKKFFNANGLGLQQGDTSHTLEALSPQGWP